MIALAPDRYEGYMLKGINERQKSNLPEAINQFRQASKRAADVALPHLLLGQALEQTGDLVAAKEAYNQAMTAEPANTEARDLLRRLNEKGTSAANASATGESNQRLSAAPAD
jgi:Flp pilus assembly protein TadD